MRLGNQGAVEKKKPFLKKGEGIARFNSVPKKPVKRLSSNKRPAKSNPPPAGSQTGQQNRAGSNVTKKESVGNKLKAMATDKTSAAPMERKGIRHVCLNKSFSLIGVVSNRQIEL